MKDKYRMYFAKYSATGYRCVKKATGTIHIKIGILQTGQKTDIKKLVEAERIRLEEELNRGRIVDDIYVRVKLISLKAENYEYITTDEALIGHYNEEGRAI
jgi:hypothetical protein